MLLFMMLLRLMPISVRTIILMKLLVVGCLCYCCWWELFHHWLARWPMHAVCEWADAAVLGMALTGFVPRLALRPRIRQHRMHAWLCPGYHYVHISAYMLFKCSYTSYLPPISYHLPYSHIHIDTLIAPTDILYNVLTDSVTDCFLLSGLLGSASVNNEHYARRGKRECQHASLPLPLGVCVCVCAVLFSYVRMMWLCWYAELFVINTQPAFECIHSMTYMTALTCTYNNLLITESSSFLQHRLLLIPYNSI